MTDGALDFARYAPQRPQLVASQPDAPPRPGELGQLFAVMRNALVLIRQCLWIAAGIIWHRARTWFEVNVLRSLFSAWLLGSIGWGGFIGAALLF